MEKLNNGSHGQKLGNSRVTNGRDKFQEKCGPTWNFRAIRIRKENHQCLGHVLYLRADTSDYLSSHLLEDCWLSVNKRLAGSLQTVNLGELLSLLQKFVEI